jgi:hypothetical protein
LHAAELIERVAEVLQGQAVANEDFGEDLGLALEN